MRVWVTGSAGFLGSHIADALIAQGHDVSGNDNFLCGSIENFKGTKHFDCSDYDDMKILLKAFKPDVLVHCAATAHEGLSTFSPSFVTQNVFGASVATFSAAIAAGVKRIVYMSSMARYGKQRPPFTEDMKPAPVDPYGVAKVAAEEVLKILCQSHNVKWSIAVPHNIIGLRQRHIDPYRNVCSIMMNRCKQGKPPIVYGDGSHTRCFSPVSDCIPSILKMIHGDADGEIVNIGPDTGTMSIKELAETICNITGSNLEPVHMASRPNEVAHAFTSSDKARKLLGYKEQQSVKDCLKEMAEAIEPLPFIYDFPLEIVTDAMPETWRKGTM